jgi:hypothetical protein
MKRLNDLLATVLAMGIGFLMTLSLLLDGLGERVIVLLQAVGVEPYARAFAPTVLQLVTTTVAFTIVIGLINLLGVHFVRAARFRRDGLLSLLLVLSAVAVLVVVILERGGTLTAPTGEPSYTTVLRNTVLYSVEASLAGLLAFSLVYGAVRLTRNRVSVESIVFLIALVAGLLARAGVGRIFSATLSEFGRRFVDAGATGILLGIALAVLVTGIRVLIGQDRSYRE